MAVSEPMLIVFSDSSSDDLSNSETEGNCQVESITDDDSEEDAAEAKQVEKVGRSNESKSDVVMVPGDGASSSSSSKHNEHKQEKRQPRRSKMIQDERCQVHVKNICTDKDAFIHFLGCLEVAPYQQLEWETCPQNNQAFILFKDHKDAAAAQRSLNNCSVGGTDKKLSACLQYGVGKDGTQRARKKSRRPPKGGAGKATSGVPRASDETQIPSRTSRGRRGMENFGPQPPNQRFPYATHQTGQGDLRRPSGQRNYPQQGHHDGNFGMDDQSASQMYYQKSGHHSAKDHLNLAQDYHHQPHGKRNHPQQGYRGSHFAPDDHWQSANQRFYQQPGQHHNPDDYPQHPEQRFSYGHNFAQDDYPFEQDYHHQPHGWRNYQQQGYHGGQSVPDDHRQPLDERNYSFQGQRRTHSQQPKGAGPGADLSQHLDQTHGQHQTSQSTIPPLMTSTNFSYDGNDDQSSVVSGTSERSGSFSNMASSLHVVNIDGSLSNDGFWKYLSDQKVSFKHLKFLTSKEGNRYAVIHFASAEEATKVRSQLNNRWIFHNGPKMRVRYSYLKATLSPNEDRQPAPNEHTGVSQGSRQRGRGRGGRSRGGKSRNRGRTAGGVSDTISECSEVRSMCSVRSQASSSQLKKSASLHVTNIGESVDLAEFCDFLESLDLDCQCSELIHETTNTQFTILQFTDGKKAAAAKEVLNNTEWTLQNDVPLQASFSLSNESSRSKKSSGLLQLGKLDGNGLHKVEKWLDRSHQNENLEDESQILSHEESSRQNVKGHAGNRESGSAQNRNGHGRKGNYRGRGQDKIHTAGYVGSTERKSGAISASPDKSHNGKETLKDGLKGSDERKNGRSRGICEKQDKKQMHEQNLNDVVLKDLPKDISELDVVELVKLECQGFIDARLVKNKEVKGQGTFSSCFLKFKKREDAMEAVLHLYGKPIRGHCLKASLCLNNNQMEPAIARKVLAIFKETEIPEKTGKIRDDIELKIQTIESDVTECQNTLEENLSFADLQRCESSIAAHEHHLNEQRRFFEEFNIACRNIGRALDDLQPGALTLSEVHKLRHHFERECRHVESPLPVFGFRSKIEDAMMQNTAVVLQGETGSGKSTQIPQYLVDMALQGRQDGGSAGRSKQWRVVCTQPRRVAALTLAKRVAEEYGCQVGEEVGYFVGNRKSVGANTVVTFMTDRKLLNLIIADPDLSDYTCVIVDEAHERSVDTDILLATLKKLLKRRLDLHLLIMSATIDIKLFTEYLDGCKEITVPGRTFPVEKRWCGDDAGIGEGDYTEKAVQCAAKVHRQEEKGDILVFLTSANEIEQACRNLSNSLGQRPDDQDGRVLVLPLHGRLQPEEQMKVFADTRAGQRKVIFATNVAETSVTIKGIRYVIDTGVVKECQYDPKRSMSLLKVTTITRASAEQRAGRAGRTAPGVCYRLYTKEEYEELEETMKPEILRVHLGMAALQLLELGVEDVQNFDFIQAPDREAMQQAMTTLRLLGAVDATAKLTPLGRKMATLTLEPRLSKLVLEGADKDLTSEAVIIAALISAPGNVFYRGGSDKDKEKADRLKLKFCHECGDIITMLNAYGIWNNQPEKKQKAWCMENSMNSKTLRATRETVKEVAQVLKREHKIECNPGGYKVESLDKAKTESLQKIIMSAYFQTLSLYNGHPRAGYTVLPHQKSGNIHPSSSLVALGCNPRWVVYEEFKQTSRDFLFNVTQVQIDWLQEVAPIFHSEINVEALHEMALKEAPAIPLGTALMRRLTMKRNEKLRFLEDSITKYTNSSCVIQINRTTKELQMFVNMKTCQFATTYVESFLKQELKAIQREQIEVPVGESGVVRQVVVAGAETEFILMAKDYRTLEVSNVLTDMKEDVLKETILYFCSCTQDEILDVYKFQKQTAGKWGRVTFISPQSAQIAQGWMKAAFVAKETTLEVRPLQGRGFANRDIRRVNSRIVITWYTWPSKKHAFINFETSEDAFEVRDHVNHMPFQGSHLLCQIKRNNTRALFIQNVPMDASNEELEEAIKIRTYMTSFKCSIAREPPKAEPPSDQEVTQDIYRMFAGTLAQDEMEINILTARSERTQSRKAIVNFECDDEDGVDECIQHIQQNPLRNSAGQIYKVKMTASCLLFCRHDVYDCLEEEIDNIVETVRNGVKDLTVRINKSKKTTDWVINVAGGNIQEVHRIRRVLLSFIQGESVALTELCEDEISFQMKNTVLQILHKNGIRHLIYGLDAHAMVDTRRHIIVIFGKDDSREVLKEHLRNYIKLICNHKLKEISLTAGLSEDCTKGRVIRALVRAYGPWLKKLVDKTEADQITLNMRQGNLLIEGNQQVFDKVLEMVRECLQDAGLQGAIRVVGEDETDEVECQICYTSVEGTEEVYRLSACSHGFHLECLQEMFEVRLKSADKNYPIECPCDGCGTPILLCDIRILCNKETKRRRLYDLALESHVNQKSNGELKFCPTADCNMIYKTTKDAEVFSCPECRGRLCSSCGAEPHKGYTCKQFKDSAISDLALKEWMSGKDVKKCPVPTCGILIEKNAGCFHMRCLKCKKHICWHCLDFFDTENMCYVHLTAKHGGCFRF